MTSPRLEQERDRVPGFRILAILVWALAVGLVATSVSTLILHTRSAELGEAPAAAPAPSRAPRAIGSLEQTSIESTAAGVDLREAQRRDLESFRWVDRDAGIAAIPIDRAIDLLVEEAAR